MLWMLPAAGTQMIVKFINRILSISAFIKVANRHLLTTIQYTQSPTFPEPLLIVRTMSIYFSHDLQTKQGNKFLNYFMCG